MNPEKKITATMKTTPATMPTQAAAWSTRLGRRGGSVGGGDDAAANGPVVGSEDDVVSLMSSMMRAVLMRLSRIRYESAVNGGGPCQCQRRIRRFAGLFSNFLCQTSVSGELFSPEARK
jgi:hypothetical protein